MTVRVVFEARAQDDLDDLFEYIADHGSVAAAQAYTDRLRDYCLSLANFPERGRRRDEVHPGLRTIGFRRRATIAFTIDDDRVVIVRVLYRGRDVDPALADPESG